MYADPKNEGRLGSSSPCPTYGRFVEPDPIGYEEGPNLYAYVRNDPINWIDPLGLCGVGEVPIFVPRSSRPEGDVVALGRYYCRRLHGGDDGGGSGIDMGDILGGIGAALDKFAEDHLKPPEGRRQDETFIECAGRIASPENAAVGAAAVEVGRGNPALYPRGAPAGASGTSYISTTVRAIEKAFGGGGVGSRGNYWFGAKTIGGAIGRGISRVSVVTGVAVGSFEVGRAAGAVDVCQ